jgi:hypothetical protein
VGASPAPLLRRDDNGQQDEGLDRDQQEPDGGRWGKAIWVSDGVVGHYCSLEDEREDIQEVLDDYASGYRCDPQAIIVNWSLFDDGDEVRSGRHTFNVE